jgi:hypothetical protein
MSYVLHTPNLYLYTWTVVWRLTPAIVYNLQIKFLVQRKGPEELTEAYPERPSKEDGEEV